ncbi:MAG: HAD hydrolase family protein [Chloroflexi bacterium]|nr:HAD hydrolase family protein [Chloroflexota bacterium]
MTKANKARILIIEDSLGIARALNRTLSLPQGGGHWVEIRDSGEAALERLRGAQFDLLITDLRLPGMNGLAVLEHARQISPETRSILITAFGSPQVEERARRLSNAYLPKPFRLHDLIQVVQRVLSEPIAHKQSFLGSDAQRHRDVVQHRDTALHRTADATTMNQRKAAYLQVLACDLDGTLAEHGEITAETWAALRQARSGADGMVVILVTDHTLDNYAINVPYKTSAADGIALCDAIVAENGTTVYFPQQDTVTVPASGPSKGAGLRQAVRELGYSPHNVVACGDAKNDQSLFQVSELAVAMSNAPADIQALADTVLPQTSSGDGAQLLVADLLDGRIPDYLPRPNRRLLLGHRTSKAPVYLDPFALVNGNLGIFGANDNDEHMTKSSLISSLIEKLFRHEYQFCIIDLKGNYRALKTKMETATGLPIHFLGGQEPHLLPVANVINFCESNHANIVLDLSTYTTAERITYVQELLPAMQKLRARLSRPHWFLMEDIHELYPPEADQLTDSLLTSLQSGGFGLVSDHPSRISSALLESLNCWLLTRLSQPEEIAALRPFLTKHTGGPAALSQLPSLPADHAYLCLDDIEQSSLPARGFIKLRTNENL